MSTSQTTERLTHTPGPWWVDNRRPHGALQIQGRHRGPGSSFCVASVNYYEDDAANANLIAAAPDLYQICKEVLDWVHGKRAGDCITNDITQRLVSAINKVEGKS